MAASQNDLVWIIHAFHKAIHTTIHTCDPYLEIVYSHVALPAEHQPERKNIITYLNFTVYSLYKILSAHYIKLPQVKL